MGSFLLVSSSNSSIVFPWQQTWTTNAFVAVRQGHDELLNTSGHFNLFSSVSWGRSFILWAESCFLGVAEFSVSATDKANHSGLATISALDCVTQPLLFMSAENISTDPNIGFWYWTAFGLTITQPFCNFHSFGSGVREMGALSYRLPSSTNTELIWLQCHFTQLKPISINWLPNIAWPYWKDYDLT